MYHLHWALHGQQIVTVLPYDQLSQLKDLDFEVDKKFLKCKEFLFADVVNGSALHLVIATKQQLEILGQTKRWFFMELSI